MRRGGAAHEMTLSVASAVANSGANTHAVGVGYKDVEGKTSKQLCVRVHVAQKLPKSLIPPQNLIPPEIDGIPTDVVESPPAYMMAPRKKSSSRATAKSATTVSNPRQKIRPILGGISAAQFEVTAGTIACLCRSVRHGDDPEQLYLLSNNHIFANVNKAQIGDEIYQQSSMDEGTVDDTVAHLTRFVPLGLNSSDVNRVDCAIAAIADGIDYSTEIASIGKLTGTAEAKVGLKVRKHGRTTSLTHGKITDIDYDATVGMDHHDSSVKAVFHHQIRIQQLEWAEPVGLGGDSGSLIVQSSSQKAIGLYFAGPQSGSYGVANQIDHVLSELEIELV